MRFFLLLPLLLFLACQDATGQKPSSDMLKTEQAVRTALTEYLTAGDNSDAKTLEAVLNPEFRVCVNQFMGKPGVTVIDRTGYIGMIAAGKIGGSPRTVTISSVEIVGNVAVVRAVLESDKLRFNGIYTFAQDGLGDWTVLSDTPFTQPKS